MKKDGKLNKKAKITIKALESKNKLFKNILKESSGDMSLEEYCNSVNSDANYIEAFKDWVKEGIHSRDILPRSRWNEIWDDFGGTFYDDEEEEEVSEFKVDVDAEKPLKVWKDGSRWKCSDGSTYMSYLKPQDVVHWLRKDYGKAWLVESTNRKVRESTTYSQREDDFDFTIHDPNEDTFDNLVADFNAMEVDQKELDSLGLDIRNSLHGPYGIYLSGNSLPDVVINDFETPLRAKPYRYKISIYQTQEKGEELYNEIYDYLSQKINPIQESKLKESNLVDSYNSILKDIKEYILMCNDSEDRFSGKKSFDLSKRIFIGNLSKTYMIHTNHIEEWFREVESDLIKEGYSFWWNRLQESKIKVLYDNLTEEIRNFILHDDEMDSFSGFDSYEFAKEEFFEKLSDKYQVTVDCIEELFSDIEYELAHEDEDISFQESKKHVSKKRIKEDSLDDPEVDLSQSFKGKDLETLRNFQNDSVEFFREVVSEELYEKGFSLCRFPKKDGFRFFVGGIFSKKVAEPGQNIYVTVEIGEYGKISANGVEYSADDLAKSLYEANKYYSMIDNYFTIDNVYQASIYGDSGQWIMRFKCEVPKDVLENYYN